MKLFKNPGSSPLPNQTSQSGVKKRIAACTACMCLVLLFLSAPASVFAQEDAQEKKDNTGTNPANFTYDARFYMEMADLDEPNGSLFTGTFELRAPLGSDLAYVTDAESEGSLFSMGKRFGVRMRVRYKSLSLDNSEEAPFGASTVSGIGDIDARLLIIAYAHKRFVLVPGLEVFFDTATNDALGYGTNVFAPVVFGVFPGLVGKGSLFAPGYQYLFDGDGDISRSQIDLYFVWALAKGRNWLILDPQVIIDHELDTTPALIEAEWGYMIAPSVGASTYIRPGVGIGEDKPYLWNFEAGLKFVWR